MEGKLIKSPLNYIGGKYKLLPQLLPLFPNDIRMLYDVFGGGANVSLNVNSEFVLYNDIVPYVSNMFAELKGKDASECLQKIQQLIVRYDLSKTNRAGFEQLRDDYNTGNKSWDMFYTLMCFSFNNQYRFNNKQEYNSSFGKHKCCFSEVTENKFSDFIARLNSIDISFLNKDFRELDFLGTNENDLVYFDPPYLISCGNYNDGKRGFNGWSKKDDLDLMALCDELDRRGTRFALSNVFEHKGLANVVLSEWSKKYNIHHLKYNYNNCNYQEDNKSNKTIEVLVTNY